MNYSPETDAYIAKAAPFAQEILNHLRAIIHQTVPNIKETTKWGMPHFETDKVIVASMAAFKNHCSFGFWNASLLSDPEGILNLAANHGMGHLGKMTNLKDLPKDAILKKYIKEAAALEQNHKQATKKERPKIEIPASFLAALEGNKKTKAIFDKMSPSHQKEYNEWIAEAKRDATRDNRIAQALEWIAEGKSRHWKY